MRAKFAIPGIFIIIIGLLAGCIPLPGIESTDPDVVATAAVATLSAATKSLTFGATPETIYYGSGCKADQPTRLIPYFYKLDTWVPSPSSSGGTILGIEISSTYTFENDSRTADYPQPEVVTYSADMTSDGYRYAVVDLSTKTFTGEAGWINSNSHSE